jgi:RimJ/RimL family protein N-acetyltransferase
MLSKLTNTIVPDEIMQDEIVQIADSTRLTYRLMGQNDAQALWELDQDPKVMHFLNGGQPTPIETIKDIFLPRMKAYTDETKGWGIWKVSNKITQEYLGWVLVRPMDFFSDNPKLQDIEFGWLFFKKAWGKGYATEAAIMIKNAIVRQTNIAYLSALALEDNYGSISVMKKVGMHFNKKYIHKDARGDLIAVHYQMSATSLA